MSENASVQAWATPCARGTGRTSALSGPTRKVSAAKSDSLGRAEIEGASQAQDGECPCRLRRSSNARVPAIGEEIAVDGTDLAAFANGQRFLWRAGGNGNAIPTRTRVGATARARSSRNGGGYYGYRLHMAVCVRTGLPLARRAQTARHSDSLSVASLLDTLRTRGYRPQTRAMDKSYDHECVHGECESRSCHRSSHARTKGVQHPVAIFTHSPCCAHAPSICLPSKSATSRLVAT
jgi:hypothetical protein